MDTIITPSLTLKQVRSLLAFLETDDEPNEDIRLIMKELRRLLDE